MPHTPQNLLTFSFALSVLLCGCAHQVQYVATKCPAPPPRPQVSLPAPGELSQALETLISGPESKPSKPESKPSSPTAATP